MRLNISMAMCSITAASILNTLPSVEYLNFYFPKNGRQATRRLNHQTVVTTLKMWRIVDLGRPI